MSGEELPRFVRSALESRGLLEAFAERPPAQRAHYVRRILRAARASTAEKRLEQMLSELEGGLHMKRPWTPRPARSLSSKSDSARGAGSSTPGRR